MSIEEEVGVSFRFEKPTNLFYSFGIDIEEEVGVYFCSMKTNQPFLQF